MAGYMCKNEIWIWMTRIEAECHSAIIVEL